MYFRRRQLTMNSNQPSNKKKNRFTIIKDDSNDGHGGYGAGSISLENMSSVIVDPNEKTAYLDMDAMHARSAIERRVKYMPDREDVPNPKKILDCLGDSGTREKKVHIMQVLLDVSCLLINQINVHINPCQNMCKTWKHL